MLTLSKSFIMFEYILLKQSVNVRVVHVGIHFLVVLDIDISYELASHAIMYSFTITYDECTVISK